MKIEIESKILRYYLRNVSFINGTSYAGKSTMVEMLAEKYDMVHCGENYHAKNCDMFVTPEYQPNIGCFQTKNDWHEFLNRTPDECAKVPWSKCCATVIDKFGVCWWIAI